MDRDPQAFAPTHSPINFRTNLHVMKRVLYTVYILRVMPIFTFRPSMKRVSYVATVLSKEGFGYLIDELNLRIHLPWLYRLAKKNHLETPDTRPERIRKLLEKLGGAYVKLGQLLSLRPNLIPAEYCHEFSKLQDSVQPFPFHQARAIIEKELGKPLSSFFSQFDKTPIGSASIGQVHSATLRAERKHVVVKIQRPDVKTHFEEDIEAMYFIAHRFDRYSKSPNFSAVQIVREFERYTKEELDYSIEAEHITRFYRGFSDMQSIVVPELYPHYCTPRLLTMDYLDGTKLSDMLRLGKPFDRHDTAQKIFALSLRQLFEKDIFHADLHPGNIFLMANGKLGLVDFGITGTLNEHLRDAGIRLYVALMDGNADEVFQALLALDDIPANERKGLKQDIQTLLEGWRGKPLNEAHFTHMLTELLNTSMRHQLQVPPDMMLLGKSLLTAEGTCATIYPQFDIVGESKPYLAELLKTQIKMQASVKNILKKSMALKDFIEKIPRQTLGALSAIERGSFNLNLVDPEISELGKDIDTSSDRISAAMIVSSFIVAGALILQVNLEPHYLGYSILAVASFGVAFAMAFVLIASFFRKHAHGRL